MTQVQKWGIPIPKEILQEKGEPRSYWGATGIFQWNKKNPIQLLHNRQWFEPEHAEYPILMDWVHERGLERIREFLRGMTDPDDTPVFRHLQGMYGIVAQPKGGYIYIGAWRHDTDKGQYELEQPPAATWSGDFPIPESGERVEIVMNKIGPGFVVDYAQVDGYLGVRILPDALPPWFRKQNPHTVTVMAFGKELKPVTF